LSGSRCATHYHERVNTGVDSWYDTIKLFYSLQNLLTRFAVHHNWRPCIIRALQGVSVQR
jgi:hypothetical protein